MKKVVLLSCDDLSEYVVDDELLVKAFAEQASELEVETVSWSKPGVDWSKYDYAVVRTTWDYTKRRLEFLKVMELIEESGCKLLNPKKILEWSSTKSYLQDIEKKGIKIIPTLFLKNFNFEDFKKNISDWNSDKFVLKPIVGASADKIKVLNRIDLCEEVEMLENKSNWFVQPFIESVFTGEISCIYFNGDFSHALRKVPKDKDFRVQEEHGASIISYEPTKEEKDFAETVVETFTKDLLYSRVDFLQTSDGPRLMELELIEPSLYFRKSPGSAENFVKAFKERLELK